MIGKGNFMVNYFSNIIVGLKWFELEWLPRFICLNTWSLVNETAWSGRGGAFFDKLCHQGQAMQF